MVIQIYRPDSIRFKESLITSQIDDLPKSIPVGIGIYAGNPDNFQTPSEIQKQIEITQDLGYGFAIFCWEYKIMGFCSMIKPNYFLTKKLSSIISI